TPDPARSDALESRFQRVRQAGGGVRQAGGGVRQAAFGRRQAASAGGGRGSRQLRWLEAPFRTPGAAAGFTLLMEPGLCRVTPMTEWPFLVASNSRHCPAAPVYPGLIPIAPG